MAGAAVSPDSGRPRTLIRARGVAKSYQTGDGEVVTGIVVSEDDDVRVTAVLVQHAPRVITDRRELHQ